MFQETLRNHEKGSTVKDAIEQMRLVAAICTAGEFVVATTKAPSGNRKIIGDATDRAILRFSDAFGAVGQVRDLWKKYFDIAFNSKNMFQSLPGDGTFETEVKEHAQKELIMVALLGIVDPPRDEVPNVVKTLRGAGIRIGMVTGDSKLTAESVARSCGIISNPTEDVDSISNLPWTKEGYLAELSQSSNAYSSIVISGPELINLNDGQWNALCEYDEVVFARTSPEQKLRIIK